MSELKRKAEVVASRLSYHFLQIGGDERWDVPKELPFMKEVLNDVDSLVREVLDTRQSPKQMIAEGLKAFLHDPIALRKDELLSVWDDNLMSAIKDEKKELQGSPVFVDDFLDALLAVCEESEGS